MKTTFISSLSLWNSPRNNLARMQTDLAKATTEVTTGRFADVGLELGYKAGQGISLRQQRSELDAFISSNGALSLRMDTTNAGLDSIRNAAEDFMSSVISRPAEDVSSGIIGDTARSRLMSLVAGMNTTADGQFIFGGINAGQKPLTDYESVPTSAAKSAVDAAFVAAFGFSQTDPAVSTISAADMSNFLDGAFSTLFDEPAWQANWSSASSQNIESRISLNEKTETSYSANDAAIRKLAMAYTMAFDLGNTKLAADVQQTVMNKVISVVSMATKDIVKAQAGLGVVQNKITGANNRMEIQKNVLDDHIGKLEGVDPAEAKTRVDALTTQIQISYSITSQLQKLSLVNYI